MAETAVKESTVPADPYRALLGTSKEKAEEEKTKEEPEKPAEPVEEDLTPELKEELGVLVTSFLEAFSVEAEKEPSLKQLKLVFNMVKNSKTSNIAENFKTIKMGNDKFKRIEQANANFLAFLPAIGFSKTEEGAAPPIFKFVKTEEETSGLQKGDIRNIEHVLTLI